MDSFLSWIGGKKALREIIVSMFPINYDRYIEVFGGAGWVFFHKQPESFEVYNDYNSNLANMFYTVKHRPLAFLEELGLLPINSREEFIGLKMLMGKEDYRLPYYESEMALAEKYLTDLNLEEYIFLMKERSELADVRRAVYFYKLIRYSYASSCTSFSCQPTDIVKTAQGIWAANSRLNENGVKPRGIRQMRGSPSAGNGTIIENKDFEALIRQYDREGAFFYCDPPYFETEKHYEMLFSEQDHYRLRDTLMGIKGKFMLSYNDCDFIRSLYERCHIQAHERINNISQRYSPGNVFKELIITNYDPKGRQNRQPAQISLLEL